MGIFNKTSLRTANSTLYDDAIAPQTQEIIANNQKTVTNNQVDSFVALQDNQSIPSLVAPLAIVLTTGVGAAEQFLLDLTNEAATTFLITNVAFIVNGQTIRIHIIKNTDQSISFSPSAGQGPDITKNENFLILTRLGNPVKNVYGFVDATNEVLDIDPVKVKLVFVDAVVGNDNNTGLSQFVPVKTDDRAYAILEKSLENDLTIIRFTGTYTLTETFKFLSKTIRFAKQGGGTDPVIINSTNAKLEISGELYISETKLKAVVTPYFELRKNLNVSFISGTALIDSTFLFKPVFGLGDHFTSILNILVDDSFEFNKDSGSLEQITNIEMGAENVKIPNSNNISGLGLNIASHIFNIKGPVPIFTGIFRGSDGAVLRETGIDVGVWTVNRVGAGIYEMLRDGIDLADQGYIYTILIQPQDQATVSAANVDRAFSTTVINIITVSGAAAIDKDFSMVIYKNV